MGQVRRQEHTARQGDAARTGDLPERNDCLGHSPGPLGQVKLWRGDAGSESALLLWNDGGALQS